MSKKKPDAYRVFHNLFFILAASRLLWLKLAEIGSLQQACQRSSSHLPVSHSSHSTCWREWCNGNPLHKMRLQANEILLEIKMFFSHSHIFYLEAFCRKKYKNEAILGEAERSRKSFNTRVKALCNRESIEIITHQNIAYSHLKDGMLIKLSTAYLLLKMTWH